MPRCRATLQGEAGAEALAALSRGHVQHLCLLGTALGNEGAQALVGCLEAGGFAALGELSVSACGMDLEGGLGALLAALRSGKAPALKVRWVGAAGVSS